MKTLTILLLLTILLTACGGGGGGETTVDTEKDTIKVTFTSSDGELYVADLGTNADPSSEEVEAKKIKVTSPYTFEKTIEKDEAFSFIGLPIKGSSIQYKLLVNEKAESNQFISETGETNEVYKIARKSDGSDFSISFISDTLEE